MIKIKIKGKITELIIALLWLYLLSNTYDNIRYLPALIVYTLFAVLMLFGKRITFAKRRLKKLLSPSTVIIGLFILVYFLMDYSLNIPMEKLILYVASVVGIVSVPYMCMYLVRKMKKNRLIKSGIDKIDKMTGENFEKYCELLFARKGYKVTRTPLSGDFGADLIISKDNQKIAVQCKRYHDKVSLGAVQEVVGAMAYYKCTGGMVVTNSYFTSAASELAKSNNIALWDRDRLIHEILS